MGFTLAHVSLAVSLLLFAGIAILYLQSGLKAIRQKNRSKKVRLQSGVHRIRLPKYKRSQHRKETAL